MGKEIDPNNPWNMTGKEFDPTKSGVSFRKRTRPRMKPEWQKKIMRIEPWSMDLGSSISDCVMFMEECKSLQIGES